MLASNVVRLSRLLTRGRATLDSAYLKDQGLREAYQAYFLPPNMEKVKIALRSAGLPPGKNPGEKNFRILDLGSGPGAATLGALEFFAEEKFRPPLEFVAVDQVAENLKIADELFRSRRTGLDCTASLKIVRSVIEEAATHLAGTTFDLVLFSNVVNELFMHDEQRIPERTALVQEVMGRLLSPDGSCIIIEPALRETSRELLQLRDGLLEQGCVVRAPCLCMGRCPALTNPKDWCHEDIPWEAPGVIRELGTLAGLRRESLKFSFLVLQNKKAARTANCDELSFRVVSEPLISKGKSELYLCGRNGRHLAVRLDKDATPRNRIFDALRRGDVAVFEGLIDEGRRLKIGKETAVVKRALLTARDRAAMSPA